MSSEQDLQVDASGRWLLAPNNASHDVTVYSIEPDGSLAVVAGSPFPAGNTPMRIAVHPTLHTFYVSHAGDNTIGTFRIGPDGSLSAMQVTTVEGFPRDLAVEPQGRFLYVADMARGVRGYEISDDGSLTQLLDSPYTFASSRPYEIEIDSKSSQLLVLDLDNGLAAFSLDASGSLTLVPGSPLSVGGFAHTLSLSGDDRFAYVGFPFDVQILGFALTPNAMPSLLAGSPFAVSRDVMKLYFAQEVSRLYAITREGRTIQPFSIAPDGSLVPDADPLLVVDAPDGRVPNGVVFHLRLPEARFRRGDSMADGAVDLADAVFTLNHLFQGSEPPVCLDAADADDTGRIDLADPVYLLNHLFRGGAGIPAPGLTDCGVDPTDDGLAECGYSPGLCAP